MRGRAANPTDAQDSCTYKFRATTATHHSLFMPV
jgi:hypothetical protein